MRYLFILLFLCFGCTNTSKKKTTESPTENTVKTTNFSFVDSIQVFNIDQPFRVWQYRKNDKLLSKDEFQALQLENVFITYSPTLEYRLLANLNLSKNYKTLLFGTSDNVNFGATHIVTYDSNYDIISHKLVDHHEKKGASTTRSFIDRNSIFIENTLLDTSKEFIIRESGKIEESNKPVTFKKYRYLGKFHGYLNEMPMRTVKAKSGLIIRDIESKPIGKVQFGETVFIVDYTKDSITIKDEGKTMKAPKARIVFDAKKVKTGKDFYIEPSNIGYVFSGFLYDDYGYFQGDDFPYAYTNLQLGAIKDDLTATIDLREIFEIKRINFNRYKNKIIERAKLPAIDTTYKKGKVLTLAFANGEKLILKDTTYQAEYTPTRSYNVMLHESFPNAFMVSESMFFTNEKFTVLSRKTGDTLQQFRGYPYISPTKKYSVAVFPEFECMQDTYLIVNHLKDGKYQNYASLRVQSWSYPYKLDANNSPVDHFSIYWISDTEFILYAKNPEECYLENPTDYFYLKYKIK